ncbi:hypothetical protein PCASD_14085 [Puccinia coronata f. sp. avenae]|uniref:Diphthamide biosynthesis protein 4 n=1 Tax=Puccinia coronata f. sp. avenae TaxID=200324 RepID=A0A2N5TC16_9BASI|nr:hypothetical protein PCASD_14085 [Puccinia coronata f. sp. avenae]
MADSSSSCHDERTEANYYELLQVSKDATASEIRIAYLRLIKLHHPDKLEQSSHHPSLTPKPRHTQTTISDHRLAQELIHAYATLVDPISRKEYDLTRLNSGPENHRTSSSKSNIKIVSQVLDLSEFTQLEAEEPDENQGERFIFPCRCGGNFLINEVQMEADINIIGCDGCSLNVKVEYQLA